MQEEHPTKEQFRNKQKLIQQNIRLKTEIDKASPRIALIQTAQLQELVTPAAEALFDNHPLKEEIAVQEKQIRELKNRLNLLKSQNAKENTLYIKRQEDELIVVKKQMDALAREKQTIEKFRRDKMKKLEANLPINERRNQILNELREVVKFNRDGAAKVGEVEREIRRYHLMLQSGATHQGSPQHDHEDITKLETDLQTVRNKFVALEDQWKPQLHRFDSEHQEILKVLASKKQQLAEAEHYSTVWETRMLVVRDEQQVLEDRKITSLAVVSLKLKKKLQQAIEQEEAKKNKVRKNDDLKYQFTASEEGAAPVAKKNEKIIEKMEDDKNVVKIVENTSIKKPKTDKSLNTENSMMTGSTPKVNDKELTPRLKINAQSKLAKPQRLAEQTKHERKWQEEANPETPTAFTGKAKTKPAKDARTVVKSIGMGTTEYND